MIRLPIDSLKKLLLCISLNYSPFVLNLDNSSKCLGEFVGINKVCCLRDSLYLCLIDRKYNSIWYTCCYLIEVESAEVLGLVQLSDQYTRIKKDDNDYKGLDYEGNPYVRNDYEAIVYNDEDPYFLITYNSEAVNKLSAERKGLYPYQEVQRLESNNVSELLISGVMSKLKDISSFEYAYYTMTKDWWKDYVDCYEYIEPDERDKKFIIYLNEKATNRIKEYSNSFPRKYNGFSLEYYGY